MKPIEKLIVEDLTISFRTTQGMVRAVRGVDFKLYEGETLAVVGESGSGKSVTSRAIMGILAGNGVIDKGSIIYEGEDLTQVTEEQFHELRGNKIGMIFQDPMSSLNPIMRIGKQITEGIILNGKRLNNKYKKLFHAAKTNYKKLKLNKKELKKELKAQKKEENADIEKLKLAYKENLSKLIEQIGEAKRTLKVDKKAAKKAIKLDWSTEKARVRELVKELIPHLKDAKSELKKNKAVVDKEFVPFWEAESTKVAKEITTLKDKFADATKPEIKQFNKKIKELKKGLAMYKAARYDNVSTKEVDSYKEQIKTLKENLRRYKKVTKLEAFEKAMKIMIEVGISEPKRRFKQYPFQFSGGMRQRIVIAIALTANPDVLICDEPTTALDVTIQAQILELINDLKKQRNLSVIFITHDLGVVANMADRIAVMYAGKIVEIGSSEDIFYAPRHPYTWALLSSMPDLTSKERLTAIPGTPPNMLFPPVGDAFAERNRYAMKIDFEEAPPMFKISDSHYAATWLLHEDAPKVDMPKVISRRIKHMLDRSKGVN